MTAAYDSSFSFLFFFFFSSDILTCIRTRALVKGVSAIVSLGPFVRAIDLRKQAPLGGWLMIRSDRCATDHRG